MTRTPSAVRLALAIFLVAAPPLCAEPPRVNADGDALPEGAIFRFGSTRFRSGEALYHPALSPDGKFLATAGQRTISFWDLQTGRVVRTIPASVAQLPPANSAVIVFSPTGKHLAYLAEAEAAMRVVDLDTGKIVAALGKGPVRIVKEAAGFLQPPPPQDKAEPEESFLGLRFSPDGKELRAFSNHRVVVWDVRTETQLREFDLPGPGYAMSADGNRVAVHSPAGSREKTGIALLDGSGKRIARMPVDSESGTTIATLSDNGKVLAALLRRVEVRVWDGDGKDLATFRLPSALADVRGTAMALSDNGKLLALTDNRGTIYRWDIGANKSLPPLHPNRGMVCGLCFRNGATALVTTDHEGALRRWDWGTGQENPMPEGYLFPTRIALSPDGRSVAVGDRSGRFDLWDVTNGKRLKIMLANGEGFERLAYSPDGKQLAFGTITGETAIWDPVKNSVARWMIEPNQLGRLQRGAVRFLQFGTGGRPLFVGTSHGVASAFDPATARELWKQREGFLMPLAISHDGKTLAAMGWEPKIYFCDADTGAEKLSIPIDPSQNQFEIRYMSAAAFSPDDSLLVTGHGDGLIYYWDGRSGKRKRQFKGQDGPIWSMVLSADGKWFLTGGEDQTIRVWETATGQEVQRLTGMRGSVRDLAMTRDGKVAVSGGDATAIVWSLRPKLIDGDVAALWDNLGAADAAVAYRATWTLADHPADAVMLLRAKIAPVPPVGEERISKLIADLEHPSFKTRETATQALAQLDACAEPALRGALNRGPKAEAQQRINKLLVGLVRDPTPEEIRNGRAVKALELAATAEAKALLKEWAAGAAGAKLTEDAKAAAGRIAAK